MGKLTVHNYLNINYHVRRLKIIRPLTCNDTLFCISTYDDNQTLHFFKICTVVVRQKRIYFLVCLHNADTYKFNHFHDYPVTRHEHQVHHHHHHLMHLWRLRLVHRPYRRPRIHDTCSKRLVYPEVVIEKISSPTGCSMIFYQPLSSPMS